MTHRPKPVARCLFVISAACLGSLTIGCAAEPDLRFEVSFPASTHAEPVTNAELFREIADRVTSSAPAAANTNVWKY